MKKIMKKALAFVMAFAMVAGFFAAVGAEEAKAATSKTLHLTVEGDTTGYTGVAIQAWSGVNTPDTVRVDSLSTGWGETNDAAVTVLSLTDGKADITIQIDSTNAEYGVSTGMQVLGYTATQITAVNTGNNKADVMAALNDAGSEIWMTFNLDSNTYSVTTIDPSAITADDVEDLITAIGEVSLESLAKITAAEQAVTDYLAVNPANETDDIENYATLTAARAAYDALAAAAVSNKTIHITVNGDTSAYTGVAVQTWCGVTTPNTVRVDSLSTGWGETNDAAVTVLSLTDGKADVAITIDKAHAEYNLYTGMQLLAYTATAITTVSTGNIPADLMAALESDSTDIWMTFTLPVDETPGSYTVTTIDPSAITADDVETLIDAIGDVTLESLSAITTAEQAVADYLAVAEGNTTDDIENYATLTAARARYDELKAADDQAKAEADAQAAGELTLYVKAPETWTDMGLWAWTSAGNLFEAWPGQAMTACENNEGYYKATIRITGLTSVIFNSSNNEQTKDITDLSAGTYWFDLTLAEGDTQYSAEYVTEAPEGWTEEEKAEIEVLDPEDTTDDETGDDETGDDETAGDEEDAATAWDDATLKVHVQMPDAEGWDKLGAYLFGTGETFGWTGGSGELTGAWPGVELLPEVNSENGWYAFGGTFADGYYMLIINNFVSDAEAAEGAEKLQAADLEITDGEYWITIALDEETGKYVATTATEAPEDYDGEGLESVVEDPAGDDETGDDETGDDETGDDVTGDDVTGGEDGGVDKDDQPATGDNAPIAVVTMIALVAGASAVVIRKRRVA